MGGSRFDGAVRLIKDLKSDAFKPNHDSDDDYKETESELVRADEAEKKRQQALRKGKKSAHSRLFETAYGPPAK